MVKLIPRNTFNSAGLRLRFPFPCCSANILDWKVISSIRVSGKRLENSSTGSSPCARPEYFPHRDCPYEPIVCFSVRLFHYLCLFSCLCLFHYRHTSCGLLHSLMHPLHLSLPHSLLVLLCHFLTQNSVSLACNCGITKWSGARNIQSTTTPP